MITLFGAHFASTEAGENVREMCLGHIPYSHKDESQTIWNLHVTKYTDHIKAFNFYSKHISESWIPNKIQAKIISNSVQCDYLCIIRFYLQKVNIKPNEICKIGENMHLKSLYFSWVYPSILDGT